MRRWRVNAAENYSLAEGREVGWRGEWRGEWREVREVGTVSLHGHCHLFFHNSSAAPLQDARRRLPLPPLSRSLLVLLLRFHLHAIRGCD